jgi:hypothetical protein
VPDQALDPDDGERERDEAACGETSAGSATITASSDRLM